MARAERELTELQRRKMQYNKMAEASEARFVEGCAQRQIEPCARFEIREKLLRSLSQLHDLNHRVAQKLQSVKMRQADSPLAASTANTWFSPETAK